MKLFTKTNLAQAALVLIFAFSAAAKASAQTPAPVDAPAAVPAPEAAAPAAPVADAAAAPAPVTDAAAAQPSAAALAQPSSAENAIVNNAATLNTMAPATPVSSGPRVTDMLATPAQVRPLPEKYLVVKKERSANDAEARLMAARSALAQGHYQAALELFDDLSRKNPNDIRSMMGRAVALQKLGQYDAAMDTYQVILNNDPRNIEALTNMLGLLKGEDAPIALKKLEQLRTLYPANAEVTAQLGMAYGMAGDYANAIKYLDMADALKPGSATVLYNKAVAYDRMGNSQKAGELYRKIILLQSDGALDPGFPIDAVRQRLSTLR